MKIAENSIYYARTTSCLLFCSTMVTCPLFVLSIFCPVLYLCNVDLLSVYEPWHDKTNKMSVRPAKTQISLGIRPIWSESSLSAWRNLGRLATHWAHSEDSIQTGRIPRLIWVFAGRAVILLVLSCCGSYLFTVFLNCTKYKTCKEPCEELFPIEVAKLVNLKQTKKKCHWAKEKSLYV